MAGSVVMLCAEYGRNLEYSFVYGHESLLIELGALRKVNGLAEIVQLKYVSAAFSTRKIYFGGMYFGKVLTL